VENQKLELEDQEAIFELKDIRKVNGTRHDTGCRLLSGGCNNLGHGRLGWARHPRYQSL
jgi:hypothetical protein